jgi:maltose phosphorylase
MVFGYGGLRTDGDLLILKPALPGQWRSYRFRIRYRDALLEVRVNGKNVELQVVDGDPVRVRVYGADVEVDAGGISVQQRQPGELIRVRPDKGYESKK